MDSDLADKYNDGIVPAPDLSEDIPPLRQAGSPAAPDSAGRHQWLVVASIVAAIAVGGLCCLLATVFMIVQARGGL